MNRNRKMQLEKNTKAQAKKLTATAMALLLGIEMCTTGMETVQAKESDQEKEVKGSADAEAKTEESSEIRKEETVYVKTDASGNKTEVTVSDWLKNPEGASVLEDASDLKDIVNVKGDEAYTQGDDGELIWTSRGSDIYYQGTSDAGLPVEMKISYYLDGREISPEKLAGKSGKVTIRFDYTNHAKQTAVIDGKEEEIYTLFMMVSGMILPGDHFKNVSVSNGKVISDGNNNIVIGIALPGLEDSLKLSELDLEDTKEIPDYVEVTADAEDFELEMTATVASCGNLEELGLSDIDSIDELEDALDELQDASTELVDGTGELLDGVNTLKDSFVDFKDGLDTLDEKTGELLDGTKELKKGVDDYTAGADTLNGGISQLVAGIDGDGTAGNPGLVNGVSAYMDGASKIQQGIGQFAAVAGEHLEDIDKLAAGAGQLKNGSAALVAGLGGDGTAQNPGLVAGSAAVSQGISELNQQINGMISQLQGQGGTTGTSVTVDLSGAKSTLDAAAASNNSAIEQLRNISGSLSSVRNELAGFQDEEGNLLAAGQIDSLDQQIAAIEGAIGSIEASNASQAGAAAQMDEAAGSVSVQAQDPAVQAAVQMLQGLAGATAADSRLQAGASQVAGGVKQVYDGAVSLDAGIQEMAGKVEGVSALLPQITESAGALVNGANDLVANNEKLSQGLVALSGGGQQLKAGSDQLTSNSEKLKKGAGDLADGAGKLKEGTAELADAGDEVSDGIGELADGAQELADGMKEFDEEGIQELSRKEKDLAKVLDRLRALEDADSEYQTFTKLAEGMKGKVSFLIESDGIRKN